MTVNGEPTIANQINLYFHCARCFNELPDGESPQTWQRIQVGWTKVGLQVWCQRHDCNIAHLDFGGQKVTIVE